VATECSRNDGSETQYYVVILDRLQDRSGGLEQAPESRIRGPLTVSPGLNREDASVCFLEKHVFGPLGSTTTFEECESLEDLFLFIVELLRG